MRGDKHAGQRALEERVLVEYLAAQMRVVAPVGKLGPLDRWLEQVRPRRPRTVRDMILAFQDAQARGAKISIRKVEG